MSKVSPRLFLLWTRQVFFDQSREPSVRFYLPNCGNTLSLPFNLIRQPDIEEVANLQYAPAFHVKSRWSFDVDILS